MNPQRAYPAHALELILSQWRHRELIAQMTKREVIGRYRGSIMGLAWSFFNPLVMLAVYTFVFSVVFKARWGIAGGGDKASFAVFLFVGLIIHSLFAECINRAPGLILSNVNYVKKVVFPLEILPTVALGSALFHALISLLVLLIVQGVVHQKLPVTVVYFPVVLLPLVMATAGFAWLLSALGVYVRDIAQITGILTTILLFLSPVFYPVAALPKEFQAWVHLNPLTVIIEESREILIFGVAPNWQIWLIALVAGAAIAIFGFWWFQKTRKGFADVL